MRPFSVYLSIANKAVCTNNSDANPLLFKIITYELFLIASRLHRILQYLFSALAALFCSSLGDYSPVCLIIIDSIHHAQFSFWHAPILLV